TVASKAISELTELEIKQAASAFCKIRRALSWPASFDTVTRGIKTTSVISYLPSASASLPLAVEVILLKASFEFSAMARKVVIRQLLMAATNKCSGDQTPSIPPEN